MNKHIHNRGRDAVLKWYQYYTNCQKRIGNRWIYGMCLPSILAVGILISVWYRNCDLGGVYLIWMDDMAVIWWRYVVKSYNESVYPVYNNKSTLTWYRWRVTRFSSHMINNVVHEEERAPLVATFLRISCSRVGVRSRSSIRDEGYLNFTHLFKLPLKRIK